MTWLSRLLPPSNSLQRLADKNRSHRDRQGRRNRRMAHLELLENRTLLSVVGTSLSGAGVLTLTLDANSDNVTINETGNTNATVTGTNNTVINPPTGVGHANNTVSFSGVKSIVVSIPGGARASNNSPNITLEEVQPTAIPAPTFITSFTVVEGALPAGVTIGPNLTLNVGGVNKGVSNPGGTLALWTTGSTLSKPLPVFGTTSVTVTNSLFQNIVIDEAGCCQQTVTLQGDTTPTNNTVFVSEGVFGTYKHVKTGSTDSLSYTGDQIILNNDNFGLTTLDQGQGPAVTPTSTCLSCNGAGDVITVDDSYLTNLNVSQQLQNAPVNSDGTPGVEGGHQLIEIGQQSPVEVNYQNTGITATQGNGDRDKILICNITSFGLASSSWLKGPDNIVTTQGSGKNDQTTIANSFVWGSITATQADVADLTGKDNGDCIIIANSTAVLGNIEATQGDGNYDFAAFYGDTTGYTNVIGTPNSSAVFPVFKNNIPVVLSSGGLMQIIQGNGLSDTATLDCGQSLACCPLEGPDVPSFMTPNVANDVNIQQGAFPFNPQCEEQTSDTINVNCTIVSDNMTLVQGFG